MPITGTYICLRHQYNNYALHKCCHSVIMQWCCCLEKVSLDKTHAVICVRSGVSALYDISYTLRGLIGFVVAVAVSISVSILINRRRGKTLIPKKLLSPMCLTMAKLLPDSWITDYILVSSFPHNICLFHWGGNSYGKYFVRKNCGKFSYEKWLWEPVMGTS